MPYLFLLKISSLFVLLFSCPRQGQARKLFENSYISFEIGENWTCKSFGVNWVCHHQFQGEKPALILLMAKIGKSTDNTDMYKRIFTSLRIPARQIKKVTIHQQNWMANFSKNSISSNMFSRSLGTVCCDDLSEKVHIFIGFYAHREIYTKYANQFLKAIRSLRLSEKLKDNIDRIRRQTDKQRQEMMSYIDKILNETDLESEMPPQKSNRGVFLITVLVFAVWAGFSFWCLFLFLNYRKKRKQKIEKLRAEKIRRRRRRKRRSHQNRPLK